MTRKNEPIWFDNPWFPPGLLFVPSAKAWAKICALYEWEGGDDYPLGTDTAKCLTCECENGARVIIIMLAERLDATPLEAHAALAHECSHAADRLFQAIGEPAATTEFRAHVVGGIFLSAARAYERSKVGKK